MGRMGGDLIVTRSAALAVLTGSQARPGTRTAAAVEEEVADGRTLPAGPGLALAPGEHTPGAGLGRASSPGDTGPEGTPPSAESAVGRERALIEEEVGGGRTAGGAARREPSGGSSLWRSAGVAAGAR